MPLLVGVPEWFGMALPCEELSLMGHMLEGTFSGRVFRFPMAQLRSPAALATAGTCRLPSENPQQLRTLPAAPSPAMPAVCCPQAAGDG